MNKIKIITLVIVVILVGFFCFKFLVQTTEGDRTTKKDFTITVNDKNYNVIVGEPPQKSEKYPLLIYYHGGGYKTLEPFELRKLSQIFAKEGFLTWIPEREPVASGEGPQMLKEAQEIGKEILKEALNHSEVDRNNIQVVSFCLGDWAALREHIYSSDVKSISLLSLGANFYNTVLYDNAYNFVEKEIDYSKVSPKIFIMVAKDDMRVDTRVAEILRQKLVQAKKVVDAIEYPTGGHLSLAGDKEYLVDLTKYLKGEKIKTVDLIETNKQILELWEAARVGGYWEGGGGGY